MSTQLTPPSLSNSGTVNSIAQSTILGEQLTSKHSTRRQFLKVAAAATLSNVALSGCGWILGAQRAQATSKGGSNELYIYTQYGYTDEDLLARFTKETGIKAIANVFDANEAMLGFNCLNFSYASFIC